MLDDVLSQASTKEAQENNERGLFSISLSLFFVLLSLILFVQYSSWITHSIWHPLQCALVFFFLFVLPTSQSAHFIIWLFKICADSFYFFFPLTLAIQQQCLRSSCYRKWMRCEYVRRSRFVTPTTQRWQEIHSFLMSFLCKSRS